MKTIILALALSLAMLGCTSVRQGITMRAQAPTLDEAFRKFSLALTADGYVLEVVDPIHHELLTSGKELKENERPAGDVSQAQADESRIAVKMDRRGRLYDVVVTPMLRYAGGAWIVAGINHPLREKWQRIVHMLVEKEYREED